MPNKVIGSPKAVGYWGSSSYRRVEQEQTPGKIVALLQDKLITRGQPVWLYAPVTSGIPCTCQKDTNSVSDRPCPECYGTAFVPGYTRFLHETVFFTASQVDQPTFTILPQQLTTALVTGTQVPGPSISTPLSPQALDVVLLNATAVFAGSISRFGQLTSPGTTTLSQVFAPTVTTSGASLNNVELDRTFKPNYLRLSTGATSGFLQTGAIPYFNPNGDAWEAHTDSYLRGAGQSVVVEFSANGGPFFPLADISGANPPPAGAGTVSFRVTLTRAAASDRSPGWSAVRARHVNSHDYNSAQLTAQRDNLDTGQILVLRPWIVEQAQSDTGRGTLVEWMTDRSWTMPLSFFDQSITPNTVPARISDRQPGPHPFYEYARGIKAGDRVVLTSIKWNEEFGPFTHQSFDERRAQTNEPPYADVF